MKKRTVIAVSILVLVGIIGSWNLYRVLFPYDMIHVNGKTLHLGQVYSQHLLSTVVITGDGETLLTVTAPTSSIVKQVTAILSDEVNKVNNELSVGTKMQLSTAYFDTDITLHLSTKVTYNAQHYTAISVPLDIVTVNYSVNDELQFNDIIELVQRYKNKTQQTFNHSYNFIK